MYIPKDVLFAILLFVSALLCAVAMLLVPGLFAEFSAARCTLMASVLGLGVAGLFSPASRSDASSTSC
ncbi:hypothetical protein [uncultured Corynebacterium sp.]|uniref:Uncharacterized protein n=1 Tax=Corynebacterium minutissimum TaxID=38301 RepID=A0ACC4UBJ6_9CORY|nr:hypothetical protein [uncultured Corynebacterium sp.]KKO80467.1 hypothetical protein WU87_04690 [Corynebacterium minutissimum]